MNTLEQLQAWYLTQCNGEWEHNYGIAIDTCDNPGWWVKIDLTGTSLEGCIFSRVSEGVSPDGHPISDTWIDCHTENNQFNGAGDGTSLERILKVFLSWAETIT